MRGGCRCGAVRFEANGEPQEVIYCHCRDCRRSNGAPISLFCGYRREQLTWRGDPKTHESSPGVYRSFCGVCGSPISYEDERIPDMVYLHAGVFDEPERLEPREHNWISQRLPWFDIRDRLPRHQQSSIPR